MSEQRDLFQPAVIETCGSCVHRNAPNEETPYGACAPTMTLQHKAAPRCDWWFGLEQLRSALYGRKAK